MGLPRRDKGLLVTRPKVFLACPSYGQVEIEVALSILQASRDCDVLVQPQSFSILPHNFNILWCDALNRREELGLTHFAMTHSDVAAGQYWLDTLIAEQQATGVDILSTVIPIKNERGITSTA